MDKKIVNFIRSQTNQICANGLPVLLRKMRVISLMLLAAPVVLLVRALQPLVLIRFGRLESRRIGHFIGNTEMYLCQRDAGIHPPRTFDIFYHYLPISNLQVKKMWERTGKLRISPFTGFTQTLDRLNRLLPGGARHAIPVSVRDIYGLCAATRAYLSFTPKEEDLGSKELKRLGVPDGAPFVCFYARDTAYLDSKLPNYNWHYLNFRDASIHNFIPAAEELARRGNFLFRMGAVVKKPIVTNNCRIIDYATNGRTDFMDVYMGAKCRFFIASPAGIVGIAEAFRRPITWVNYIPLEYVHGWGANQLFIPKKLWLRKEHRFLTFREILSSKIGRLFDTRQYELLEIEIIENTPEEITDVAVEMDERLRGEWQASSEDEQLQQSFWALFKPNDLNQTFVSRVGAKFLRQNRELLK